MATINFSNNGNKIIVNTFPSRHGLKKKAKKPLKLYCPDCKKTVKTKVIVVEKLGDDKLVGSQNELILLNCF